MQFEHPEILYALFLLIIPIIVHLFQLRRFKKVAFTNVRFLKKVELQTRKSSKLKKLLTLLARLLLFAALIIAFAKPFISASKKDTTGSDIYIYLDNSYSMQAKGKDGELLKRAVEDILKNTTGIEKVQLFTNNETYKNLAVKDIKNTLLSIDYYPVKLDMNTLLFNIKNSIRNQKNTATGTHTIFLISDFQKINFTDAISLDTINNYYITKLQAVSTNNISIDTVFISGQDNESIHLKTVLKNVGSDDEKISISLFNETVLAGKSSVFLKKNTSGEVIFTIPNTKSFKGKLQIDDGYVTFDNTLFFTIDKAKKINVTSIGKDTRFLSKIYTEDEFNFVNTTVDKFDYNTIDTQHLLILNELETIPESLISPLKEFVFKGGSLAIIPPTDIPIQAYTPLFTALSLGSITYHSENELAISTINFSHPFLKGVFEKKVQNFQYPTVKSSYQGTFRNASAILKYENNLNFISQIPIQQGKVYWFSAAINSKNSTFKNSPLIVPVFYNFGLHSTHPSQLYYTIGGLNNIEVRARLKKDDVIHITSGTNDFIPQQLIKATKVAITTESNPLKSGFYEIQYNKTPLKTIAYNYLRNESDLTSIKITDYITGASNVIQTDSINDAFAIVSQKTKTTEWWQLFVGLALLFLVIEVLLLKFLKP